MKKLTALFIFIYLSHMSYADSWTQKAAFPGGAVTVAHGFVIGSAGYVGGGTATSSNNNYWKYDPTGNSWQPIVNFPGAARQGAVTFVLGDSAFLALGDYFNNTLDAWIYSGQTNVWMQQLNFTGLPRNWASGFSINNKGYICCGLATTGGPQKDLWEYDPMNSSWTQKATPGFLSGNFASVSFVINGKAYVTTGFNIYTTQAYDPVTNTWALKAVCPLPVYAAAGFAIGNFGYVCTGGNSQSSITTNQLWQYNSINDTWNQKTTFPGSPRRSAVAFAINNKGYIGTGDSGSALYSDWWEYTPDSTTGISELQLTNYDLQVTPNPAKDFIKVSLNNNQQKAVGEKIIIADLTGKIVCAATITNNETVIDVKHFAKGVYTVKIDNGKKVIVRKFSKE